MVGSVWQLVVCLALALAVELAKRFALDVHVRRDELRRKIAAKKEETRGYDPVSDYARFVKADRDLKQMVADLANLQHVPVPLALRLFGLTPYVFALAHSVLLGPLIADAGSERWWWPVWFVVNQRVLGSLFFAWAAARSAALLVQPQAS